MSLSPEALSPLPSLSDEQTLNAAVACLSDHLELDTQGLFSRISLFEVLIWAASRHDSIEHTSEMLDGWPSGNGTRYHLAH